ncbi:ArsR/SmtB family transcription factor [Cellulomonas wangsupingiae]|uniref:Metalloregulator ArsR/SmtB family transcription factor n=1 Tax=Cellulomonas wangsupingiae TaxID=2968085 RepID=A0ABY5K4L2_9CELL|nr:metalloregulator ArsR/SmtB family transcription factor [Cellulomonas wangsupingiae]MCC2333731.1 metalloregulator ArsR/SmtB family transcription factor [Cellulomonas wangsupingiae]MCM0639450.1 metalloregulator ArsR/SmtB family transcription factor [Cellulomonas wangsupingiae]UUI64993.1 metalloregulator ArsR/SmtB family transcription factor [Cellulomonas wangsupingiae]
MSRVDLVLAALAEPVRRRLLEHLAGAERAAGELVAVAREEFGISQPATSQHLRVLREAGVVVVRADGPRRLYRVEPQALSVVEDWLAGFLDPFAQPLDALETELVRGRRERRAGSEAQGDPPTTSAAGLPA